MGNRKYMSLRFLKFILNILLSCNICILEFCALLITSDNNWVHYYEVRHRLDGWKNLESTTNENHDQWQKQIKKFRSSQIRILLLILVDVSQDKFSVACVSAVAGNSDRNPVVLWYITWVGIWFKKWSLFLTKLLTRLGNVWDTI